MFELPENKAIVLFDGVCNLCSSSVQLIIKRDKRDYFRFAALDSELGKQLCEKYKVQSDSIVLIESGRAYIKSDAALRIAKNLSGLLPILYLGIIFPKFLRDGMYTIIAKYRYQLLGKKNECWLPLPHLKQKFLN